MTAEEKKNALHCLKVMIDEEVCEECDLYGTTGTDHCEKDCVRVAIKALEQQPCEDKIIEWKKDFKEYVNSLSMLNDDYKGIMEYINDVPSVQPKPKTGHCKDCKWWKDSDGAYRRGIGAESKCPINRREVLEGNGYCYMFEPQESEES